MINHWFAIHLESDITNAELLNPQNSLMKSPNLSFFWSRDASCSYHLRCKKITIGVSQTETNTKGVAFLEDSCIQITFYVSLMGRVPWNESVFSRGSMWLRIDLPPLLIILQLERESFYWMDGFIFPKSHVSWSPNAQDQTYFCTLVWMRFLRNIE